MQNLRSNARTVLWIGVGTCVAAGIAALFFPVAVAALSADVLELLNVDPNALLVKLIVPARPTWPAEGLRKLELMDAGKLPTIPIPTDEQPANLALIMWRNQLNEMGRFGANSYAAVPRPQIGATDLLAMSNESYRMIGSQTCSSHAISPQSSWSTQATPKSGAVRTHTQTRQKEPLSPEQTRAIHSKR